MYILKIDYREDLPENYTSIAEYPSGILEYYLNGILHREDGPAVIWPNEIGEYFLKGKFHRVDGPVIIRNGSIQKYYINDENITEEVEEWIKENNIPYHKNWNNSHKILFK